MDAQFSRFLAVSGIVRRFNYTQGGERKVNVSKNEEISVNVAESKPVSSFKLRFLDGWMDVLLGESGGRARRGESRIANGATLSIFFL